MERTILIGAIAAKDNEIDVDEYDINDLVHQIQSMTGGEPLIEKSLYDYELDELQKMCEKKGLQWKRRRKLELIEMLEVQEGRNSLINI